MPSQSALIGPGVIAACVLLGSAGARAAAPPFPFDPWRLCPQAIAVEERTQAIPKHLLSAIALAESGRKHPMLGKRMPWPWSVMAEGQGRYLPTKAAAIDEVRRLQARGISNIDVGCMQVNLYHHADAFASLEQAFDPASNVAYAAQFLRSLFADSGSWQEAAGRYHSATPEHKIPYREKVVQLWNQQQRLGFEASAGFGSGALTAGLESGGVTAGSRVRPSALLSPGRPPHRHDRAPVRRSSRFRYDADVVRPARRQSTGRRHRQSRADCRPGGGVRDAAGAVSAGTEAGDRRGEAAVGRRAGA